MPALQHRASDSLFSSLSAHSKLAYPISPPSDSQDSFDGGSVGGFDEKTIITSSNGTTPKTSRRPTAPTASSRRRGTTMPDGGHGSETRGSTSGATEPASDEISVRRERGKLAQRAFRQRQIDMIRILKDENAKLKDAISTISTAAYRSQRELKDAITEACRIAELNPSGAAHESSPAQQADDDFEHGSVTTQSPRPSSAQPLSSSYPPLGQGASAWPAPLELRSPHIDTSQPGLGSNSLYGFDPSHNQGYVNSHADLFAPPVAHMNAAPINGLRPAHAPSFSTVYSQGYAEIPPRGKSPDMMPFDQSIQPYLPSRSSPPRQEHATAILQAQAPEDIMPYLGPRAYTIAGQVYWATLGYAWQVLRTLDTSYPAHSPETLGTVYNLFHIDATNPQSTAVVKDHLYRRLAFRKQRAASVRPGEAPSQHHLANHGQQHQQHPPPGLLRDRSMGSSSSSASTAFDGMSGMSSVTPPTPQHHVGAGPLGSMESLMSNSTTLAGLDPAAYIPALAVEEQLRHMLGPGFPDLEAALRSGAMALPGSSHDGGYTNHNTAGGGSNSSSTSQSNTPTPTPLQQYSRASIPGTTVAPGGAHVGLMQAKQVLHTIARQAVFFADGPRWHPESVASAASMWTMEWP